MVADVCEFEQVEAVAQIAVEEYGWLDTWVHLAAVGLFAPFDQTQPEEFKRVVDVDLMGQVYGAMAALPRIKREGRGALVHISSVVGARRPNTAAMTLAGAYPERFVLGVGVSHRPMVEMRGHDYSSPLSNMRSYLKDMRQARFEAVPPEHAPPWIIAALGPRMLELSRDLADGAHPYLVTPQHTAGAREILGEGPLLVVEQAVAPTREREKALRLARSHLSPYMRLPNYCNSWLRQGFSEQDLSDDGSDRLAEGLVAGASQVREAVFADI